MLLQKEQQNRSETASYTKKKRKGKANIVCRAVELWVGSASPSLYHRTPPPHSIIR
uniref:Uncharacterized protein n=1 Tax=Arundo donax TaxID=35708 RepID=A0A0A9E2S7_ARUDO